MNCQNCNAKNSLNAKFCHKCGQLLKTNPQPMGSVDTYFARQTRGCQICLSLSPTKNVNFYQLVGMVAILRYSSIKGRLCKKCIDQEFKTRTITTLLFGWWGVASFILTPFVLTYNVIRFVPTIGMKESEY